ncbi:RHS repeat-associated core domain-containing protein, partial [Paucibacter sp. APW11]
NGRLFDPRLGVFLQADPMLQDPFNLQNYNRYGYCYNNPMGCTDPSGYAFLIDDFFIALVVIWGAEKVGIIDSQLARQLTGIAVGMLLGPAGGAYTFAGGGMTQAAIAGFASGVVSTGSLQGGLQGAFSAGMFYGAGNVIEGGDFFSGGANPAEALGKGASIALHGVVGCVTTVAGGGSCGSGALSAAFSKAANVYGFTGKDHVSGVITSAIVGGTASVLGGGTFANGATTGSFGYLFNCLSHPGTCTKKDIPELRQAVGSCNPMDTGCTGPLYKMLGEAGYQVQDFTQPVKDFALFTAGTGAVAAGGGIALFPTVFADTVTVTSWAGAGLIPDLAAGRWVMTGGATWGNYINTGLWGPQWSATAGWSWSVVPFANSITSQVTAASLRWPSGWEWFKGLLGQRILGSQ